MDTKNQGYLERSRLAKFLSVVYEGSIDGADSGGSIPRALTEMFGPVRGLETRRLGELDVDEFTERVRFDGQQVLIFLRTNHS